MAKSLKSRKVTKEEARKIVEELPRKEGKVALKELKEEYSEQTSEVADLAQSVAAAKAEIHEAQQPKKRGRPVGWRKKKHKKGLPWPKPLSLPWRHNKYHL